MLTPPTVAQYALFSGREFADVNDDGIPDEEDPEVKAAEYKLQEATDAFFVLTALTEEPDDPQLARIYQYAVCDLARWLQDQFEVSEEINSPFTGERIGSYSYQKQQALKAAREGHETGIYWLDLALNLFRDMSGGGSMISVSSEDVMYPDVSNYETLRWMERHGVVLPDYPTWGVLG